jgi:hypothetical protein
VTGNAVDDVLVEVTRVGVTKTSSSSKRVTNETSEFEANFNVVPGEYLVTVTAVDGDGQEAVKTVTVTVVAEDAEEIGKGKLKPFLPSIPGKLQ